MIQYMKNIRTITKEKLKKGNFVRNVITLMTGTTLAQSLAVLAVPVLTRLYKPEDFGTLALFMSIVGILSVVASWRYEQAIVLSEKEEDAVNLLALSIMITTGMSLLTLIVVALFRHSVAVLLAAPEIAFWLWLVPISILGFGFFQTFNYWCTRKKKFKYLAAKKITQSTSTIGIQMYAGGFLKAGAGGLIGGKIIGNTIATAILGWKIWLDSKETINKNISGNKIRELAIKYKKFPQYSALYGLLNMTSQQLPAILFTIYFGKVVLGHYFLAYHMFSVPMSLLGQAFSQAFYPKASEYYNTNADIKALVRKTYKVLLKISILPSIFLFVFAPTLFEFAFGENWRIAGEYLRFILPWLTVGFIVSPSTCIFPILNRQDIALYYEIMLFVAMFISILVGGLVLKSVIWAIGLYGSVGFFARLYQIFLINRLIDGKVNNSK